MVVGYLVAGGWGMYSMFLVIGVPAMIVAGALVKDVR
jgi:hypothetical protein